MKRLLTDPLLQFAVLGGLLFTLDGLRQSTDTAPIEVPAHLTPEQQQQRVQAEILLREARKRGLDQGDSIIERQLQQKMRSLIESRASVLQPDSATLHAWFIQYAERYAEPARVSFEQVFYPRSVYGQATPEPFNPDLAALQQGQSISTPVLSHAHASHAALRKRYGKTLADALFSAGPEWSGPVQSGLGWHLIRVTAQHAPVLPAFASVQDRVTADWREAERERLLAQELDRLGQQYVVQVAAP